MCDLRPATCILSSSVENKIHPIFGSFPNADREKPASELFIAWSELPGEDLGHPFRGWGGAADLRVAAEVASLEGRHRLRENGVNPVEVEGEAFVVEVLGADPDGHLPGMAVDRLGLAVVAGQGVPCLECRA